MNCSRSCEIIFFLLNTFFYNNNNNNNNNLMPPHPKGPEKGATICPSISIYIFGY
jgi:hypothetical protein